MIGLVVAAHGYFAAALMHSCELIYGKYQNAATLALEKADDANVFKDELEKSIRKVDQGDGVIVFTDLLGGTPSNLSTLLSRNENFFCVTGVNLPMILEFMNGAESNVPLDELVTNCMDAATSGIKCTSKL